MRVRQLKLDVVWSVLVRVVERAVVHRIDCEIAVIAPAIGGGALAAGAVEKMLLTRQGIQWIRRQSASVTDLRAYRTAGCAEAQRDVALVIGADAAHPAPGAYPADMCFAGRSTQFPGCVRRNSNQRIPATELALTV